MAGPAGERGGGGGASQVQVDQIQADVTALQADVTALEAAGYTREVFNDFQLGTGSAYGELIRWEDLAAGESFNLDGVLFITRGTGDSATPRMFQIGLTGIGRTTGARATGITSRVSGGGPSIQINWDGDGDDLVLELRDSPDSIVDITFVYKFERKSKT